MRQGVTCWGTAERTSWRPKTPQINLCIVIIIMIIIFFLSGFHLLINARSQKTSCALPCTCTWSTQYTLAGTFVLDACYDTLFLLLLLPVSCRRMRERENKAQAHHTSTYFHTRRVSTQLSFVFATQRVCWRVLRIPLCSDSVNCPYQRSSLQPRQRKLY